MSELIPESGQRLKNLYGFAHRLMDGENGRELFEEYKNSRDPIVTG